MKFLLLAILVTLVSCSTVSGNSNPNAERKTNAEKSTK